MTQWNQVNPYGAGFQNCGAVGPWSGHDNVVLTGADTAGIHKSVNKGSLFANRDASIVNNDTKICSIEPHPTQAGRFFALTGNSVAGSLFETTDYGDTWIDRSTGTAAIFGAGGLTGNSGTSSLLGAGNGEHPRSVGRLISVDAANGYIYVGTFNNGVYRGVLGGTSGITSWTFIGLAPGAGTTAYYIRGVLYDSVADKLYISTFSDPGSDFTTQSGHIWRCANPRAGSPTFSEMTNSPMCSSAMLVLNGVLFVVAHPITANLADKGLWYLNSAGSASLSATFTKIGAVPTSGSARWMSIDGYGSSGAETIWVGSASQGTASLYRVRRASGTWTGAVYPTVFSDTHNDMGGPNTPTDPWWLYTGSAGNMLGHSGFVASTIRINQFNTNEIYVFGRSGAWRSLDDGGNWYPMVKGIGATVTLTVLADPKVQGDVYVGLGDWSILASQNSLQNVINPQTGHGSFTYSLCYDEKTTPVTLIAAASSRQDSSPTSTIWTNADVFGSGAWLTTGYSNAGNIIVALTCVYSGTTRIIIAGSNDGVLQRKVGTGAWTVVPNANMTPSGGINLTGPDTHPFAREIGTNEVYLYDRSTGVWRSTDQGLHWVRIWNHPSSNSDLAGWIDTDPLDPTVLYASDDTTVFKLTNVKACAQDAAGVTIIGAALGSRGPMKIDKVNRKIGVCDVSATPKFFESALSPISWVDKADQLYQNAVAAPQWLTYDRSGKAILALSGNGIVMMGSAVTNSAPTITTAATITGTPQEGATLTCDDGAASGVPTPTVTRQWQADGVDIGGATSSTYAIPGGGSMVGKTITCNVTWTNSVSPDAVSTSNGLGPVTAVSSAALFTVNPVITGTIQEGAVLTCSPGTFTGTPTPTETFQWELSASGVAGTWAAIGGATSNTFSIPIGYAGQWIRCHAHISNAGGTDDAWATKKGPITATVAVNPGPATVAIVFPPSQVNSGTQVVQVNANHPYGIASVEIQLNGGAWQSATFNAATGFWELSESLTIGINTISARATDAFHT